MRRDIKNVDRLTVGGDVVNLVFQRSHEPLPLPQAIETGIHP